MSGEGAKLAFCEILWSANGGTIDHRGRAVLPLYMDSRDVRGVCTNPGDCHSCQHMQAVLSEMEPNTHFWFCPECVLSVGQASRRGEVWLVLPGYYSEGYCENFQCWKKEATPPGEEPMPKHTPIRQLVLIGPKSNPPT